MVPPETSTEEPVTSDAPSDRRQWERYPCLWVASWPGGSARVTDYSVTGVALLGPQPLAVGSQLVLDIYDREKGAAQPLRVGVVRCAQQPDGQWVIGCAILDED